MPRIRPLPDGRIEVGRIANVGTRGAPAICPVCSRAVFLMFNDPELSTRECCGHQLTLETMRVDVVVYKIPPDPSKEFLSRLTPFEAEPCK